MCVRSSTRNFIMQFSINTNSSASFASQNLSKTMDAHRRTLERLSSGKRVVKPADDAGGLSMAKKLGAKRDRIAKLKQNNQNAQSFLNLQYAALKSTASILSRMSELKAMSMDVTKNESDVENYDKEFLELQKEIVTVSKSKFNGISLFTISTKVDHALQAKVNEQPGVVSLARNFIKGAFLGASEHILGEYKRETNDVTTTTTTTSTVNSPISTKAGATGINPDGTPIAVGATDLNWTVTGLSTAVVRYRNGAWADDSSTIGKWVGLLNGGVGNYDYSMSFDLTGVDLDDVQISGKMATDNSGSVLLNGQDMGISFPNQFSALQAFSLQSNASGIVVDGTKTIPNVLVDGTNTITVRVNNAGGPTGMFFDELQISGSRTTSTTTSTTSQVTTVTKIYPGLDDFEPDEFSGFIENLAGAIAQVGAQQARLHMEAQQIESAGINLESAVGKILDADIAKESTRYSKTSFLIESSTSMVGKASKMSQIALRLLSKR